MDTKEKNLLSFDIAVIGGGLAGVMAAVSAARLGRHTALIQNRPVLGGNSSSEVRVPVGGACDFNPWARESGILEEFFLTERTQDPRRIWLGETPSIWDITLYDLARKEKNLTTFLNTEVHAISMESSSKIKSVHCHTLGSESNFTIEADVFVDSTGDGTIANLAGAEWRMGREAKSEFNEDLAPESADDKMMGSSLLFHAEDARFPVPFVAPEWAVQYESDEQLLSRTHDNITSGYWWIEIGNPPYHTIFDNEKIRDELYKHLLGIWDHIKNKDDHGAQTLHIDFIGAIPGKRESRRVMGDYILREQDIRIDAHFYDAVAYGGWFCDLHAMGGILNTTEPPEPSFDNDLIEVDRRQMYTYTIPLRSLYAKDVANLFLAGRDISATHVAFGSSRLMATCAVIGQAVGTAAAIGLRHKKTPRELVAHHIQEIQQQLLKDDCYIPGIVNEDSEDLARSASVATSSNTRLSFPEGIDGIEFEHPKQKAFGRSTLETERAQLFPCSSGRLDSVELQIVSSSTTDEKLEISVYDTDTIVGFSPASLLQSVSSVVKAGFSGYISIPLEIQIGKPTFLIVSVSGSENIRWMYSSNPPTGTVSASRILHNWKPQKGSYSMRIQPDSFPYESANILSGVARPEKWTNIWVSDPDEKLPAFATLTLGQPTYFNTVHLTFDTNLNFAHMSVPGLYRAPTCVRHYRLWGTTSDGKSILLDECIDNFQRKRIHTFPRLPYVSVILEILDTNGDKSARLYEIRIYDEN